MRNRELMTEDEIHNFGVEVVFTQIRKDGFVVESANTNRKVNPQIVAWKDGRPAFIVVRTACYPHKGKLESEDLFDSLVRHADQYNGTYYFASVGIANSEGQNDEEMSVALKGVGFYVSYEGLLPMTFSNRVKVLGDSTVAKRNMNELELVQLYARSWNNLNFELIEPFLSEDVVYESQQIFGALVGSDAVSHYLRGKMATIKKNLLTSDIYAEIGYCSSQAGHKVQVLSAYEGRPCVLMAQGDKDIPLVLVLLEADDGKIKRIDLCTVVPHPSSAERTGEYPK